MTDAFREPTPGEIQAALIQFMGQNLGEIKKLDSHIVEGNSTLQGMTLRPEAVLRSIPVPPPPPPVHVPQPLPVPVQEIQPVQQQNVINQENTAEAIDPNQLMFDFINDLRETPSLKDVIFNIEKKVNSFSDINTILHKLDKKLDRLIEITETKSFKKKIVQSH